MLKCLPKSLYLLLFLSCTSLIAQEVNITFNATVKNSTNTILPDTYIKVYDPSQTAAVDSMFTDDQGAISTVLPFTYTLSSVQDPFKQKSSYLVKKIVPNVLTAKDINLYVEYTYPDQAEIFFMNISGKLFTNHSTLTPGIYMYFLRFGDGRQSELNKLVVTCELPMHVQLLNTLQRKISNRKAFIPSVDLDEFYVEVLKDGYVTSTDTISIDSSVITRDFILTDAEVPSAEFSYSGDLTCGLPVVFNASGSKGAADESLNYHWNFGDGLNGGTAGLTHIYNMPGTYDVTLTVRGNYGASKSTTKSLTINPGAIATENTGVLSVYLTNEFFEELEEVKVELVEDEASTYSDLDGIATLSGLPLGIPLHIKLTKSNYVTQVIEVNIPEDSKEALSFATLKNRSSSQTIVNAEFGGELIGDDGSTVALPVLPFNDSEGKPVKGNVNVNITPVDVAFESESFPGNFEGYNDSGAEGVLFSYGVSEYHFEKDGEELQLAEGKSATVLIPIYTSGAIVGEQIPLWSVNEENGKWIQEGMGTVVESASSPTGLALQAEVSHFSWFNCDDFEDGRKKKGLCWMWDCTTAQCIKVKVGCWVKGAQRDASDKKSASVFRSAKNTAAERDTIPPVFEARAFLNTEGTTELLMPYTRDVYMEATSITDDGRLWTGSYTMEAAYESDTFSIELKEISENPVIELDLNMLHEGYLDAGEIQPFRFDIIEEGSYQLIFNQDVNNDLLASYMLKYGDGVIKEGNINEGNNVLDLPVGPLNVKVYGYSTLDEGNFIIGLGQEDIWLEGDTLDLDINVQYDEYLEKASYNYYKLDITSEDLYKFEVYRNISPSLPGRYKVFTDSELFYSGQIDNLYKYRTIPSGQLNIGVAGNDLSSEGNFSILVEKPEIVALGLNDSIYGYLSEEEDTQLFRIIPEHNTLVKFRFYVASDPNRSVYARLYSSSGSLLEEESFSQNEDFFLTGLLQDTSYYLEIKQANDCEFVLVSEEEPVISAVQGDTIKDKLAYSRDMDWIKFSGNAGDKVYISGTKPGYRPNQGIFTLMSPSGEKMATRNLMQSSYTDHEILSTLPADGDYSIIVESNNDDTGSYQIVIDTLKYRELNFGALIQEELLADEEFCYEFEVGYDRVCHLSFLAESTSGNFNIWAGNGDKLNKANYLLSYNSYQNTAYTNYLEAGFYYIKGSNSYEGSLYINLKKPKLLDTDARGHAASFDTIPDPKEVEAFYFRAKPGDGIDAQLTEISMMPYPDNMEMMVYPLRNDGSYITTWSNKGDYNVLEADYLAEAGARITGEDNDSLFVMLVTAESAGLFQIDLHHVESASEIKVDDDFTQYPDAITESPIAASYAVKENGSILLADGTYRHYLPMKVEADGVTIEGQSRENTWLQNLYNKSSNPVIYMYADGGSINTLQLSTGPYTYDALEIYGTDISLEHLEITAVPGQTRVSGGIKGGGDNLYINDVHLDSVMWDIHVSSTNGIIENCDILSESGGIEFGGGNNIIRNNRIRLPLNNRAISVTTGQDGGNAIVENNEIEIGDYYSSENGIIYMLMQGDETNTSTSYIRNNTIRSASANAPFYALIGHAPSKIIIEGNSYYCSRSNGSRALIMQPGRTDGYSDIIVRNNIFDGIASDYSVSVYGINQLIGDHRFMICNNNFRFADASETGDTKNFLYLYSGGSGVSDTLQLYFINNIVQGNGSSNFAYCIDEALFYSDYNNLYQFNTMTGGSIGIIGQDNDILTDPQYLNEDLEVDATSGVVDEGAGIGEFLYLPEVDINGVTRPLGEGVDIGAYER